MNTHWYFSVPAGALFLANLWYLRKLRPNIVRAQLTFSKARFRDVVSRWSADDVRRFRAHFAADYLFIALSAAAGWLYGQSLAGSGASPLAVTLAVWSLPAAGLADLGENLLHQRFLRSPPGSLSAWLFPLAGLLAAAKVILWLVFFAVAVVVHLDGAG